MRHPPIVRAALISALLAGAATPAFARSSGVPDNLTNLSVDQAVLETIDRQLPERQAVGAEFLDEAYSPNLKVNAPSQVGLSFISEGAGYRNSVGYFAYQNGTFDGLTFGDIDSDGSGNISAREVQSLSGVTSVEVLFANASAQGSGGILQAGDTTVIGGGSISQTGSDVTMSDGKVFDTGTNIGFFLSANAWTGSTAGGGVVNGWDNPQERATYWTLDFLNPENDVSATVDDISRSTRHVAMLGVSESDQVIMGFEDLNRNSGDNDFNDVVFIVHSDPVGAFVGSDIPTVSSAPTPAVNAGLILIMMAGAGFSARRLRR